MLLRHMADMFLVNTYMHTFIHTYIRALLTYLLTYLLTHSIEQSPSSEASRFSASQAIPRFYWIRRFITAFTKARHLSLSWVRSVQSLAIPPTSWRSILILFLHLCVGLPSNLFLSVFPTKTLYAPFLSP